jgi:hypothetical protein
MPEPRCDLRDDGGPRAREKWQCVWIDLLLALFLLLPQAQCTLCRLLLRNTVAANLSLVFLAFFVGAAVAGTDVAGCALAFCGGGLNTPEKSMFRGPRVVS